MTLTEAEIEFPGCTIKTKGFMFDDNTQLLYKSEINKSKRIICLVGEEIFVVPSILKARLAKHFKDKSNTLDSGIVFYEDKEAYKIPVSYLSKLPSKSPREELKEIDPDILQVKEELPISPQETLQNKLETLASQSISVTEDYVSVLLQSIEKVVRQFDIPLMLTVVPLTSLEFMFSENIRELNRSVLNREYQDTELLLANIILLRQIQSYVNSGEGETRTTTI